MPGAADIPVIETERLRLRAHRLEDFPACVAMWTDPIVTKYTTGRPQSREEVWSRLLRYIGHWTMLGYGFWAVEEKSTGLFIGELGFAEFQRTIEPPIVGIPELGWALQSIAHGKGYATEAVRAAIAWGDGRFPRQQTVCLIHPDNAASIAVAVKCGFSELRRTVYNAHTSLVYERQTPDNASQPLT